MNIEEIRKRLAQFAQARNWDQFHTPKNLSMALAAEAAELLDIFQWLILPANSSRALWKTIPVLAEKDVR